MVSAVKTRRPISTISYNSPEYLQGKLEELRKAKIISVWFFIKHKKEQDERKDQDRKSTRLNSVTSFHLVCRLLLGAHV